MRLSRFMQFIDETVEADGKILILMRGVSGSGKSYKAEQLAKDLGGTIISSDKYPNLYGDKDENGIPSFDYKKQSLAHEWAQKSVKEAMEKGVTPIIVDNTNIQAWEMRPYVEFAEKYGYAVRFETPESPWWKKHFKKNMTQKEEDELVDELYKHTRHIPRPKKREDFDVIRHMVKRWEHDPSKEDILRAERENKRIN